MGASTKKISTAPAGSDKLRGGVIDYINGPGGMGRLVGQRTGPVAAAPWAGGKMDRGQIRDVTSRDTQSLDSMGGVNSAFFNNMMGQLAPAFAQRRAEGLAAAGESSGNLTGSGFANRLGGSINRSLGEEQAALANYAVQGLQMEMQRQQGDANRAMTGDVSNQGADTNFLQALLQGRGQDLTARGQDIGLLDSNANRDANMSNADAQRFAGLLMQQAQPYQDAIIQSGGIGALLGPLAQGAGAYMGSRGNQQQGGGGGGAGAFLGDLFGSVFGRGGGGQPSGPAPQMRTTPGYSGGQGMPNVSRPIPSLPMPGRNLMAGGGIDQPQGFASGMSQIPSFAGGQELFGSGMGPGGQLNSFASGENDMLNRIIQQGGLPQILQIIMGLQGMGGGMQPGGFGGQGGSMAGNIGGLIGSKLGSPIPVIGPLLGGILGQKGGQLLGKVGGWIKGLF